MATNTTTMRNYLVRSRERKTPTVSPYKPSGRKFTPKYYKKENGRYFYSEEEYRAYVRNRNRPKKSNVSPTGPYRSGDRKPSPTGPYRPGDARPAAASDNTPPTFRERARKKAFRIKADLNQSIASLKRKGQVAINRGRKLANEILSGAKEGLANIRNAASEKYSAFKAKAADVIARGKEMISKLIRKAKRAAGVLYGQVRYRNRKKTSRGLLDSNRQIPSRY